MKTATASTPARRFPQPALQPSNSRAPTRAWARAWRQHLFAPALLLCAATLFPPSNTHAQTIATGAHDLALKADGSVLAWADNRQAQLGQGRTVYSATSRDIALPAKATMVRTSRTTALVPDEQGNVWSGGRNLRGELGDGTRADRPTPQVIFRGATSIVNGGSGRLRS